MVRYILVLTKVPVTKGLTNAAEGLRAPVEAAGSAAPPPPPLCCVLVPPFLDLIRTKFPQFEVIVGSSLEDFTKQEANTKNAEIVFWIDCAIDLLHAITPLLENVRWFHNYLAGVDLLTRFLTTAFTPKDPSKSFAASGVLATNSADVFSSSLKEYALMCILYFAKQVPRLQEYKEGKVWNRFIMGEIRGKTVGFVGFGNIAKNIAKAVKFLDMRCIAVRRDGSRKDPLLDEVYGTNDANALDVYRKSDFVICSLPGTPQTINSVSVDQFAAMKKSGVFISIGRGCVVDESAICSALMENRIKGAAMDVFQVEPLAESSPLWKCPNLLISSHNADWCEDYSAPDVHDVFEKNMNAFLKTETPTSGEMHSSINLALGY